MHQLTEVPRSQQVDSSESNSYHGLTRSIGFKNHSHDEPSSLRRQCSTWFEYWHCNWALSNILVY